MLDSTMMTSLSLLLMAIANVRISSGQQQVLYTNAGPLDPNTEDLLTHIMMTDDMFIKMDISIDSFPSDGQPWKYLFFIGDSMARVPDIWLWDPVKYPNVDGFAVHFSRDGGGQLTYTLQGSVYELQLNTVYTLQVCYDQTTLTTRMSGGDISGIYTRTANKKIHDDVEEPVYVGYPSNDAGDADVIITNLVIGSGADCSTPLNLGPSQPSGSTTSVPVVSTTSSPIVSSTTSSTSASPQQIVLYTNAGPLDPNTEDLLTHIMMTDDMFIQMDISIDSFPSDGQAWKYLFFIGDPMARVPDIWLWDPVKYPNVDGFAVHFSRDGGGQLTYTLQGSGYELQLNTVYTLEICYDQTTLTTRMSGGDISGIYTRTANKKIHDDVEEPVYVGYPSNDNGDADVVITNLVIGSGADCSTPLNLGPSQPPAMCCANGGGQKTARKEARMDRKCSKKTKQNRCERESACSWIVCTSVVTDQDGEYWIVDDMDENVLMRSYDNVYNEISEIANINIWYGIILLIFILFVILYKNRYACSEYKQLEGEDSITPLLSNSV